MKRKTALFLVLALVLCLLPASALAADKYVIIPVEKTVTGLQDGQTATFNFQVNVGTDGSYTGSQTAVLNYEYVATGSYGTITGDQSGNFTVSVAGSGTFKGNVYVKITDANNSYTGFIGATITVKEISGSVTGWTYDDTVWTGIPTDSGGGDYQGIEADYVYFTDTNGNISETPAFTNTYSTNNTTPNAPNNPAPNQDPPFDPSTLFTDVTVGICNAGDMPVMPQQITVQLQLNGKDFAQAVLNEGNGWRYAWLNMPDGNEWDAQPVDLPGNFSYTVNKRGDSICIQLTPEAEVAALPKTGGMPGLVWPVVTIALALCGAAVLTLQQRRKKAK